MEIWRRLTSASITLEFIDMSSTFSPGDLVEVLCPGLASLRAICPDLPPNHHGTVKEIEDNGMVLIEFPIGEDDIKEHSQVAPYPLDQVRLR